MGVIVLRGKLSKRLENGYGRLSDKDMSLEIRYDEPPTTNSRYSEGDIVEVEGELRGKEKLCICGVIHNIPFLKIHKIDKIKKEGDSIW